MSELDDLINMISRSTLNKMNAKQKKIYKIALCEIFLQIIIGRHYTDMQKKLIEGVLSIRQYSPERLNDLFDKLKKQVEDSLYKNSFTVKLSDETINGIIDFFRKRLQELKRDENSLFQARELSVFINIKEFFCWEAISGHHWIQFDLSSHLYVNAPEALIFTDLKVHWNLFVDTRSEIKEKEIFNTREDVLNVRKDKLMREKNYTLSALYRTLIILSVSFVEAYLYNLFYCIKENKRLDKKRIESIIHNKKIQDTQILQNVLFVLFPGLKGKINNLYETYKKITKYRNRYIHASAFIDETTGKSELQPLIDLPEDRLIEAVQTSIDFVRSIDEELPNDLKIIFWMYEGDIDFSSYSKILLHNPNSSIDQVCYYNR